MQHVFKIGGFLTLEYNGKSVQLAAKHLCLPSDYVHEGNNHSGPHLVST